MSDVKDDFAIVQDEIERTKSWQALARIEARLAAAEMLPAYVSGVLCDAASIPVAGTDDFAGLHAGLRQLLTERDEARAAAERLAEAARDAWRNIGVPSDMTPAPLAHAYRVLNAALAAYEGGKDD